MGCCPVVHVEPIQVPACASCATPVWSARRYPPQQLQPWLEALERLLGDRELFMRTADACREAATQFVEQGRAAELDALMEWLRGLGHE